jgi:hypothetical protein
MVSTASPFSVRTINFKESLCAVSDPEAYQIHCNNVGGHIDGLLFSLESADGTI